MEKIKEIYNQLIELVKSLIPVDDQIAMYILIAAAAVVVILLVVIIVLIAKAGKKRKAKKLAKKADAEKVVSSNQGEVKEVVVNENNNEVIEEEIKNEEIKVVNEDVKKEDVKEVVEEDTSKEDDKVEEKKEVKEIVKEEVKEVDDEEVNNTKTGRIAIGKYEVFPVNDVFLYRLKASNGEIMVVSEIYKSAKGAVSAIETVKKNVETGTLQIYEDKHGLWQFKLFASNKRLLVVSANYTSQVRCEAAANSFKKFALISPVVILETDPEQLMEEIKLEALADKKGGKIVISEDNGIFDFKLCASNGVVLCSSAEYKTKSAITGAISSMKEAINNGKFFVVKDKNGMYQFKLYSTQGRCVVIGEAYKNKAQAISAANSVSSFIALSEIVDKTAEEVK